MLCVAKLCRAQDTNTNRAWTFTGEYSFVSFKEAECIFPVASENYGTIGDSLLVFIARKLRAKIKEQP